MSKKRYVRIKAPPEFRAWLEERHKNMEALAKEFGNKKPITLMQAMRVISRTEGVDLNNEMLRRLKKRLI